MRVLTDNLLYAKIKNIAERRFAYMSFPLTYTVSWIELFIRFFK